MQDRITEQASASPQRERQAGMSVTKRIGLRDMGIRRQVRVWVREVPDAAVDSTYVSEHEPMKMSGVASTTRHVPGGFVAASAFGVIHAGFSLYWAAGWDVARVLGGDRPGRELSRTGVAARPNWRGQAGSRHGSARAGPVELAGLSRHTMDVLAARPAARQAGEERTWCRLDCAQPCTHGGTHAGLSQPRRRPRARRPGCPGSRPTSGTISLSRVAAGINRLQRDMPRRLGP